MTRGVARLSAQEAGRSELRMEQSGRKATLIACGNQTIGTAACMTWLCCAFPLAFCLGRKSMVSLVLGISVSFSRRETTMVQQSMGRQIIRNLFPVRMRGKMGELATVLIESR
jgi:hypothetical protein